MNNKLNKYDDKNFYPTPKKLIRKMIKKIKGDPVRILEPSAGKGDIIEMILENRSRYNTDISAIEIDENLQYILRGKNIKVIDSDFITYSGSDKFDLIIGNPPFDNGDKHLLKAIDILYRGEIVFLLNAETLKNPYSNTRKELLKKLDELQAEIEYIQDAFKSSERPTGVEIALIYIKIEREIENDLFADTDKSPKDSPVKLEEKYEISTKKDIEELVAEYKQTINIGTETIINYYKNHKKIGKYLMLKSEKVIEDDNLTSKMQAQLNEMIVCIRKDFWEKTLKLPKVQSRMTEKKLQEFYDRVQKQCDMDFTENNIRQFILNLISGYKKTLSEAVMEIFDKFTIKHSFSNGLYEENIHYFNGWKTNKAFKVGKKVVIPIYGSYGGAFTDSYSRKWKVNYGSVGQLQDIDTVMNYFDGLSSYVSIASALESAFKTGISRKIKSTYFTISVYKKGTIHLEFNDLNILRRFNVVGCIGKNWLPHDYNKKSYDKCSFEEKKIVKEFEGIESYNKNLNVPLFANYNPLQIESENN